MTMQPLLIGTLGLPELLIILFIVFLIFGAKKLPELGSGMGSFIKNFKKSVKTAGDELPEKGESSEEESKA